MKTFTNKRDLNAKQLKKNHKEFRKLRSQKGWGSVQVSGNTQHNSYHNEDREYQGCFS